MASLELRGVPGTPRWRIGGFALLAYGTKARCSKRANLAYDQLLAQMKRRFEEILSTISRKSSLAEALRYSLSRWDALTRYTTDGRLDICNNAAERAIRPLALGRKNWMFAGADSGGERAAVMYTIIETAKLNGLDPEAYLRSSRSPV